MRITLANWYGDKAPGETLDVDEVTAKALRRDGLVAEPEQETAGEEQAPTPTVEDPAQPQTQQEPQPQEEPQPEPEQGRKRR